MQNDPGAEWQRLTRLYQEKSDEELLALAEDFGNLTDTAQQVLRDEMRRRKLEIADVPEAREQPAIFGRWSRQDTEAHEKEAASEQDSDDLEEPVEFTWKTELCTCGSSEEAWQLGEVLRRAGIESWAERPGATFGTQSVGALEIRILVAADQLDEARAILARPIPQEIIDQSKVKLEDFVPPKCPKCGAEDPLLESVDPANQWLCESCGARWSDPAPARDPAVGNAGETAPP